MTDEPNVFFFRGKVVDTSGARWVTRNPKEDEDVSAYPVLKPITIEDAVAGTGAAYEEGSPGPLLEKQVHAEFQDAVLTAIKAADKPWALMSQEDQDALIQRMDQLATHMLRGVIPVLIGHEFPVVRGVLTNATIKKNIKATVEIDRHSPDRHDLLDNIDAEVLVAIADHRFFEGEAGRVRSEPNQRTLPFDVTDGEDPPADDDSLKFDDFDLLDIRTDADNPAMVQFVYERELEGDADNDRRTITVPGGQNDPLTIYGIDVVMTKLSEHTFQYVAKDADGNAAITHHWSVADDSDAEPEGSTDDD